MTPEVFVPTDPCPVTGEVIWQEIFITYPFWHYVITDHKNCSRHHATLGFNVEPDAFGAGHDPTTYEQRGWNNNTWYNCNKHLLFAAFRNGYRLFNNADQITLTLLRQRLESSTVPHTPKMKLDWLLKYMYDNQNFAGSTVCFKMEHPPGNYILNVALDKLYLKDEGELEFYLGTLKHKGLVELDLTFLWPASISFEGLNYLASLENEGHISKNCFVAMSFSEDRKPHRVAIEAAIKATGYEAVFIDTQHLDSDKTINDRIIAGIRACKFCVADFTQQRNGVYFEAGFALGLGKPIIYTCEKDDFEKNSHFDLKPFQHILYNSAEELRTGLEAKVLAWIQ